MAVVIPDDILQATGMSVPELQLEFALFLFAEDKVSLGQASRLARMSRMQFQQLAASRQIPIHYDVADFDEDIETLRSLGRL